MKNVTLIDTTLRDGSHAVSHTFSPEKAGRIAQALANAGVQKIEVGHGDGLAGSSCQYGFSKYDEFKIIEAVVKNAGKATVGVLLIPGIGTTEDLKEAYKLGVRSVRVATHVTEADIGAQHIRFAKASGMEAIGFLMMAHMSEPDDIIQEAMKFQSYGADAVYIADSAGALLPHQVKERIKMLKEGLQIPVGFHAHNNLGLAVANSLSAYEAGASYIDATLCGLGAGAGNAPHEVMVAVFNKIDVDTGEDLFALMDAAENEIRPLGALMQQDMYALTIGYAGVYSSFYLHAKRAAEKYGVDARDILIELGKMKTVGGQEDLILDVADQLSKRKK